MLHILMNNLVSTSSCERKSHLRFVAFFRNICGDILENDHLAPGFWPKMGIYRHGV